MLLQLAVVIVTSLRAIGTSHSEDTVRLLDWFGYCMVASAVATFLMFVGVARAIPEIALARMPITSLVVASAAFLIAAASHAWTYHVFSSFVDLARDPGASASRLASVVEDMSWLKAVTIAKDLAYAVGLIAVLRTIERSAAINDQLALRDEAASTGRALVLMLVADLFYQLTYGLDEGFGLIGMIGSLLVAVYWIHCHVRLVRFLSNAAYFVNEPHELPLATVVRVPRPRASTPARPTPVTRPATAPVSGSPPAATMTPASPAPTAVAASPAPPGAVATPIPQTPPPPTSSPRAPSPSEPDDGSPRFLR